ncbi:GNAT family N-acetyltransferase [Photobacterium sp. CCB-ST2H9]|uniref:GNAT family N-acetyltransferase n=1 Tax=Photobacterium sp. CCB-ST2H9 TaxID=2912855 RepID=UPI00200425E5|nr:GNAT family N-acetyltransferase [Photobacterium sp. CCB-ST2H9]UTM59111.1 GNAT family N-acetyltransferase [Photobacterium sp. CCB-ST2H9]
MDVIEIKDLSPYFQQLTGLLQDCVDDGASIGFLPPLSRVDAEAYWQDVAQALGEHRKLWIACEGEQLLGTVQLALCGKENGAHRAEIEKLMVNTNARGRGAGKALMLAAETYCQQIARHLLVLDTREGDVASSLYRKLGYTEVGRIPQFALNATGELDATVYFYKLLSQ